MRPRGRPPTPSAMSSPREPVDTTSMARSTSWAPIFMIEPLPNCFSIWERAACRALALFSSILGASAAVLEMTLSIFIIPFRLICWRRMRGYAVRSSWNELPGAAHQPRHDAEDFETPFGPQHGVGLVRGLQHEPALFPFQVLHRELVVDDRHDDVADV